MPVACPIRESEPVLDGHSRTTGDGHDELDAHHRGHLGTALTLSGDRCRHQSVRPAQRAERCSVRDPAAGRPAAWARPRHPGDGARRDAGALWAQGERARHRDREGSARPATLRRGDRNRHARCRTNGATTQRGAAQARYRVAAVRRRRLGSVAARGAAESSRRMSIGARREPAPETP